MFVYSLYPATVADVDDLYIESMTKIILIFANGCGEVWATVVVLQMTTSLRYLFVLTQTRRRGCGVVVRPLKPVTDQPKLRKGSNPCAALFVRFLIFGVDGGGCDF